MANVVGTCGSTKEVQRLLGDAGITIGSLDECRGVQVELEQRLELLVHDAKGALADKLETMEAALDERRQQVAESAAQVRSRVELRRSAAAEAWKAARGGSFLGGVLLQARAIGQAVAGEADQLIHKPVEHVARLRMVSQRRRMGELRAYPQRWLTRERANAEASLEALRAAVDGPHFGGAIGEEVIAHWLRGLDASHWVLHDLYIRFDTPVTLFGDQVFGAQIDHIVVGPSGVMVIDTKNWSRAYACRGGVRDPYEQAATAAHIVRCTLREFGLEGPVRGAVAACGHLPKRRSDTWVSVVRPDTILESITRSTPCLAPSDVAAIVEALTQRGN